MTSRCIVRIKRRHPSILPLLLLIALATATLETCVDAAERAHDSQLCAALLPRLGVSPNGHYLVSENGEPFFWLLDTAWRLIQKAALTDQDDQPSVLRYFSARRSQGFNVIQTVAVRHANVVNSAGQAAFVGGDFTRHKIVEGPANDYWDQCDAMLELAQADGFHVALLPLWLNRIEDRYPMVRDPSIAYRYGHFLGQRHRHRTNIIWVLGGDPYQKGRDVDQPEWLALVRAMAEGIADGVEGQNTYDGKAYWSLTLMTYHPRGGGNSSSETLHTETWLDFNMVQTSTRFNFANYETISGDVRRNAFQTDIGRRGGLRVFALVDQKGIAGPANRCVGRSSCGLLGCFRRRVWTHLRSPEFYLLDARRGTQPLRCRHPLVRGARCTGGRADAISAAIDDIGGVSTPHTRSDRYFRRPGQRCGPCPGDPGCRGTLYPGVPAHRPAGGHPHGIPQRAARRDLLVQPTRRQPAAGRQRRHPQNTPLPPPTSGNGQDWVLMIISRSSNSEPKPP